MDGLHLTPHEEELVTQTFAEIAPEVDRATEIFYDRLFEVEPDTKAMFRDVEKLSEMFHILATAVKSLSYSGAEGPDLKALGARHVTYEVTLEQFDVVGEVLMWTFQQILGERFTPEARATWEKVYTALSNQVKAGNYPTSETASPQMDGQDQSKTAPLPGGQTQRSGHRETPIVAIRARGAGEASTPKTGQLQQRDAKEETGPLSDKPASEK